MPAVCVRDIDVYYEEWGSRGAEPVLLIHGLGSSTEDWEAQVDVLARDFNVVAYDVRGHGRTSKPRGRYTVRQFSDDAAAFVAELRLGPVHVVGLSMGGMIGFQLACDHPELIRSLVIVNSGPEMILRTAREKLGIIQRRLIVRLMGMRKMGEVLAERLLPGEEYTARRRVFAERWARNDKGAYLRALDALVGWSVTERLPAMTSRTLVVTADQDYTPVSWKAWYTSLMPNASLVVIPDSRHMMPVQRPEAFHEALLAFLTAPAARP